MNAKRNRKAGSRLNQRESFPTDGEAPLEKRLRSGRKPETLQGFWAQRLQPWIDLANLLPFQLVGIEWRLSDWERQALAEAFVQEFSQCAPTHPFRHIVEQTTRWRTHEPRPTNELVDLFQFVLDIFERLEGMTWPSPETEADEPPWTEHYDSVPFQMTYSIEDSGDGRVSFQPEPNLSRFKSALEGVEISRVRRCPLCGKFYYAVRDNKGACDAHLDRARVERGRNPELRAKYEEARRFRKRLGVKKAIGRREARSLNELSEALKTKEKQD